VASQRLLVNMKGTYMANAQERIIRLESAREDMAARMDRLESNQRWTIGLMVVLHGITVSAIFVAAALFN